VYCYVYYVTISYFCCAIVKPGWGDWAGPGLAGISKKTLLRRDIMLKAAEQESQEKRKNRKDSKMYNVVLSDRRIKTASKYKLAEIPHPFTTREEYERSIQMPLGGNTQYYSLCLYYLCNGILV
jgi:U3 small nucleolar RNA-associated protein 14